MAPSQPEDTFGHIWTQLDSAERPSPRLVPVVLGCARSSAGGSPQAPRPHATGPQCSAMVFRKRGPLCLVWRHEQQGPWL